MRREPLGKRVKKWFMQGKSLEEISSLLKIPVDECERALMLYTRGYASFPNIGLREAIVKKKKIHLYGDSGVGKSFTTKKILEELGRDYIVSYAYNEQSLIMDFGDYIFQDDVDCTFILEGDNYYWRKYSLIKRIITESKHCFIIITTKKDTINSRIGKLLNQVKMRPPTKSDVLKYIKTMYPDWNGNINSVYDTDWRNILEKLEFGKLIGDKFHEQKNISSKSLSYKLIRGTATEKDFRNCKDPISFTLNWLGWNAKNFWSGSRLRANLSILSWCDANKYNFKQKYIENALLGLAPTSKKGRLEFPPYKKNSKKKPEEKKKIIVREFKHKRRKNKKEKESKKEYKGLSDDLGDFLMI